MLLCVIADLHGRTKYIPRLREIDYDLLIICGDITDFGHYEDAQSILNQFPEPYVAVHGNCDHEDVLEALIERGCNLHQKVIKRGYESFAGFGGSNPFIGKTPSEYPEDIIYEGLSAIPEGCVLVTHAPPHNTKTDRAFLKHVGSTAVRRIIEERKPQIAVCGHIHESKNQDYVGKTLVVNPGKFSSGYYALVSTGEQTCKLKRFT